MTTKLAPDLKFLKLDNVRTEEKVEIRILADSEGFQIKKWYTVISDFIS